MKQHLAGIPNETALVVGLLSGSHVINHLYLVLLPPILTVLAADFDVGLPALGLAMGVQALTNTALQLPYGYLADNYDRTVTLALCLGLGGVGTGMLAVAPTFEWFLVGLAVLGAGISGHHPAHFPLLSDATSEEIRGRAYSVHGFAGNVGFAGPPVVILGITALPGASWRHAFGLLAVVGLVYGAVCVYTLKVHVRDEVTRPNRRTGGREADGSRLDTVRAELRALARAPSILTLGVVSMLAAVSFWGITSYVAVLMENAYGVDPGPASLTLTAMFAVGAVFILVGGALADKLRPGLVLAVAYSMVGVFTLVLATLVVTPPVAFVAAVLAGSFVSFGAPVRDKLADVLSTRGDIGRNFAVVTLGIMVGNTVAPPVFGTLIGVVGYQVTFTIIASFALAAGVGTLYIVFRYRNALLGETAEPDGEAA